MLIFANGCGFSHTCVVGFEVLTFINASAMGQVVPPRLAVDVSTAAQRHLFYGEDAVSVVRQMVVAGVITTPQADATIARLRDEAEMCSAAG